MSSNKLFSKENEVNIFEAGEYIVTNYRFFTPYEIYDLIDCGGSFVTDAPGIFESFFSSSVLLLTLNLVYADNPDPVKVSIPTDICGHVSEAIRKAFSMRIEEEVKFKKVTDELKKMNIKNARDSIKNLRKL